jgi:hypothetical protein
LIELLEWLKDATSVVRDICLFLAISPSLQATVEKTIFSHATNAIVSVRVIEKK